MSDLPVSMWWNLPGLIALGGWLLWWLATRLTHNQRLYQVLLASYALRIVLAVALYAISYWDFPVLRSLHLPGGFWMFGIDSQSYHALGREMALAWRTGTSALLPEPRFFLYSFVVALIYWIFGAHLLYPLVVNAWLGAVCGLLAYLIAGRVVGERARLPASVLVGFWPSSLIWSAQLLKDPLAWCLTLVALWLSIGWIQGSTSWLARGRGWRTVGWMGLFATVMAMTMLRFYLGFALLVATAIVVGVVTVISVARRSGQKIWHLIGLVSTVAGGVLLPVLSLSNIKTASTRQDVPYANAEARPTTMTAVPEPSTGVRHDDHSALGLAPKYEGLVGTVLTQVNRVLDSGQPQKLVEARKGFVSTGGSSLMDSKAEVSNTWALLRYLPRALMIGLLAPFPHQWFDYSGSTGVMRLYSGGEMVLIYTLLLSMLMGVWSTLRRREAGGLLLLIFAVLLMTTEALAIANLGTLFRLRLLFLFPLLILASGAGWLGPYRGVKQLLLKKATG